MKAVVFFKKFYQSLIVIGNSLQFPFLLLIRLVWGFLFLQAGIGKIADIAPVAEFFYSLGIPFANFSAHLVAWVEAIGGACLMVGLASRFITIPLIITMVVALSLNYTEAVKNAFSEPSELFKQSPFTFLFASLLIFIFGPGVFSLDAILKKFSKSKLK
jgi:putative oxidoreductase